MSQGLDTMVTRLSLPHDENLEACLLLAMMESQMCQVMVPKVITLADVYTWSLTQA